jgi:la-related protein 1
MHIGQSNLGRLCNSSDDLNCNKEIISVNSGKETGDSPANSAPMQSNLSYIIDAHNNECLPKFDDGNCFSDSLWDESDEIPDNMLSSLLIVTRPSKKQEKEKPATSHYDRRAAFDEFSDTINEGLFQYELALKKSMEKYNAFGGHSNLTQYDMPSNDDTVDCTISRNEIPGGNAANDETNRKIQTVVREVPVANNSIEAVKGKTTSSHPYKSNSTLCSVKNVTGVRRTEKQRYYPVHLNQNENGISDMRLHRTPNADSVGFIFPTSPSASAHFSDDFVTNPSSENEISDESFKESINGIRPDSPLKGNAVQGTPVVQFVEHPSYELLRENGFIQHKYVQFRAKALRERKRHGVACTEMNTLFRFWTHFLRDHLSRSMLKDFKRFALEDASATPPYRYGIECLYRFYSYGLEKKFRQDLFLDFATITLNEYKKHLERKEESNGLDRANELLYGLEKMWAFLHYRKERDTIDIPEELKEVLSKFKSIQEIRRYASQAVESDSEQGVERLKFDPDMGGDGKEVIDHSFMVPKVIRTSFQSILDDREMFPPLRKM